MRKFILIMSLSFTISSAFADVQNTSAVSTQVQNTIVSSIGIGSAQDWNLTLDEWLHYQKLMQGQNGKWYPQLTPAAVLGLNAQSAQEQKHFAEIVAKEEHDKLSRELAFDREVHQALVRLYTEEPVIKSFDISPFNPIQSRQTSKEALLQTGDHLVLLTELNSGFDAFIIPSLINTVQKRTGVILDIYCVGSGDDNAIRNWAKLNKISSELVKQGLITLNHDNGSLYKTAGHVQLPYLLRVRDGHTLPVSPWSIT